MEHPAQGASLIQPFSIAIVQPAYDSCPNRMTRLCTALRIISANLPKSEAVEKSPALPLILPWPGHFRRAQYPAKSFRARTPLCKGDSAWTSGEGCKNCHASDGVSTRSVTK